MISGFWSLPCFESLAPIKNNLSLIVQSGHYLSQPAWVWFFKRWETAGANGLGFPALLIVLGFKAVWVTGLLSIASLIGCNQDAPEEFSQRPVWPCPVWFISSPVVSIVLSRWNNFWSLLSSVSVVPTVLTYFGVQWACFWLSESGGEFEMYPEIGSQSLGNTYHGSFLLGRKLIEIVIWLTVQSTGLDSLCWKKNNGFFSFLKL